MDLLILSNVMAAGGTLVLAYYSYRNIKSSEEQLKFLRKQTKVFTSQQEPFILVQDKQFNGNQIDLYLSNHGEGIAYEVAVNTRFYLVDVNLTKESKKKLKDNPSEKWADLNIEGTYDLNTKKTLLLDKEKSDIKTDFFSKIKSKILKIPLDYEIVYPSSATTFISNVKNEQSVLEPHSEDELFEFEPYFYVTTNNFERRISGTTGKAFIFDELKDFLLKNNVHYIGITFDLVSRDKIGIMHNHQSIDSCIVNLNKDHTIKEAIESGIKVGFTPLGWIEIQKKIKWLPTFHYDGIDFK